MGKQHSLFSKTHLLSSRHHYRLIHYRFFWSIVILRVIISRSMWCHSFIVIFTPWRDHPPQHGCLCAPSVRNNHHYCFCSLFCRVKALLREIAAFTQKLWWRSANWPENDFGRFRILWKIPARSVIDMHCVFGARSQTKGFNYPNNSGRVNPIETETESKR